MADPFNPLNWLKSAQDWFSKTERSSGFRPYLIFLILVFGMGICLLTFFGTVRYANITGLGLTVVSVLAYIVLYYIKSFTDPDFCRSEQHVQRVMQIELESMGNEGHQLEGLVIEAQMVKSAVKEPQALPPVSESAEQEDAK
jgi:hypothetical protein